MKPIKRKMATASAAVLLGLSLVACGGDDGDGKSDDDKDSGKDSNAASVEDFCDATDQPPGAEDIEDDDYDGQADALNDWAEDLEEAGLPEDVPDDAREGFEIQIDVLKKLDSGDLEKAADDENFLEDEISEDDQDKVKAFTKYRLETCSDLGSDDASPDGADGSDDGGSGPGVSGTDSPTGIPTDVPTDLSDLPSDFPTDPDELQSYLDKLESAYPTN